MKRYWIILLAAVALGFLMIPGSALAHTHKGVHSPFDAPKAKKSLHCQLLKHRHAALQFCPHTTHVRNMEIQLKTDCDKSSSGATVQIQWFKILMLCPSTGKTISSPNTYSLTSEPVRLPSPFYDLLEKPPQHA